MVGKCWLLTMVSKVPDSKYHPEYVGDDHDAGNLEDPYRQAGME